MGWDAFSSANFNYQEGKFEEEKFNKLFPEAAAFVKEKVGYADGSLDHGVLDLDSSAYMLERATGESCWPDSGKWTAEQVQGYSKKANWNFLEKLSDKDDISAYWSARKFLEVCANEKLSVRFSW